MVALKKYIKLRKHPGGEEVEEEFPGNLEHVETHLTGLIIPFIPLDETPNSILLSPDGSTAYLCSSGASLIYVVDLGSGVVTDTISFGEGLVASGYMGMNSDGSLIYVSLYDDGSSLSGGIAVFNTNSKSVTNVISGIGDTNDMNNVVVSPDGNVLYAALNSTNRVAVVDIEDIENPEVTHLIDIEDGAAWVVLSLDGKLLYTIGSTTLSIINLESSIVDNTVDLTSLDGSCLFAAITDDGKTLYIPNSNTPGKVGAVNTFTRELTVIDTLGDVAENVSCFGERAYITNVDTSTICVVDTNKNTVLEIALCVSLNPESLPSFESATANDIAATENCVYIASRSPNGIFVLITVPQVKLL